MYYFIKTEDTSNLNVTATKEVKFTVDGAACLPEMCQAFEDFLRGSGFHFDGHVDIVNED